MNKTVYILPLALSLLLSACGAPANSDSTLVVWHWMGDRQEAFTELARRYKEKTGTEVHFELYAPSEAYSQKIKAAAQTRTLPDVFGILGDTKDFASFVKSGYVAEIGSFLGTDSAAWQAELFQKALDVNRFVEGNTYGVKPGIYGFPLDMTNAQLLYNKRLFREAGLNPERPPQTWEQFLQAVKALRQKGTPVLVSGFGEIWLIDILATSYAINIMGEAKVYDTYRGNVPYTDPDWVRVLDLFKTMTDEGVFASGTVTMVNKTAEQTFANEKAAMAWNGSWCVNVYRGMNPGLDYGVMLPPRVSATHPMKVWGGAGNSLMVNAQSPNRDAALSFLKWMTEKDQQIYFATATNNLPSNRSSLGGLSPILDEFADDLDNTFHLNTMPANEFPRVMEAWNKGIQSIMIGEKFPEEVAQEVQGVKQREMERKTKP